MNKVIVFLQEAKIELQKVIWPNRDDSIGASVIVSLFAIVFAIILGCMDFGFSTLIKNLIR